MKRLTMESEEDVLGPIVIRPKTGTERLHTDGAALRPDVLDYWRWAHSDLLANVECGAFAEFVVATACAVALSVRDPWAPYDLVLPSGRPTSTSLRFWRTPIRRR